MVLRRGEPRAHGGRELRRFVLERLPARHGAPDQRDFVSDRARWTNHTWRNQPTAMPTARFTMRPTHSGVVTEKTMKRVSTLRLLRATNNTPRKTRTPSAISWFRVRLECGSSIERH